MELTDQTSFGIGHGLLKACNLHHEDPDELGIDATGTLQT